MERVSFETALKLQEKGFPRPAKAFGQVWWFFTLAGQESVVVMDVKEYAISAYDRFGHLYDETDFFERACVFAPTATDILQHVPRVPTEFRNGRFWVEGKEKGTVHKHENHAEVLATAWLELNSE